MKKITSYCRITDTTVILNGNNLQIPLSEGTGPGRLTGIYRFLQIAYPKFHKMDSLSKAGFLASEMVLRSLGYDTGTPDGSTSLVFANSTASLENDKHFQKPSKRTTIFRVLPYSFILCPISLPEKLPSGTRSGRNVFFHPRIV